MTRTKPCGSESAAATPSARGLSFQRLYLLLAAAIVSYGTYIGLTSDGYFNLDSLKYYTYQSNIVMSLGYLILLALSFAAAHKRDKLLPYVSTTILLAIVVTGIVYNFVLVPLTDALPAFSTYENFSTHLLAPVLALIYYLIFETKGQIAWRHILGAMVYPIAYWLVFISIGGAIDFYPYFFMDPTDVGWPMVFVWFALLLSVFVVVGALLRAFDKRCCLRK